MRLSLLFAAAAIFLAGPLANADTIQGFNLQSTLTDGYTAQGTVVVDTTTGAVENSDFTLSQNGLVAATFTTPTLSENVGGDYLVQFAGSNSAYTYELFLPTSSLVGYLGGSVCTQTATCWGYPSGAYVPAGDTEAVSGGLSPVPEPGSFVLLTTGLVGVGYLARKRIV